MFDIVFYIFLYIVLKHEFPARYFILFFILIFSFHKRKPYRATETFVVHNAKGQLDN